MKTTGRKARTDRDQAFTLIELLVVVSIIALLIAILLPSLKRARDQAKDVVCRSNLHQLGVAINCYVSENGDYLPWIKGEPRTSPPIQPGEPEGDIYIRYPFRQYHQILHLFKYARDLRIYICPRAKEGGAGGYPGGAGMKGAKTVKEYVEGSDLGDGSKIAYYTARKSDPLFQQRKPELFPSLDLWTIPEKIEHIYTEYWFNDWNKGAGGGRIPAISGNLITNVPYVDYAVMMMDAIDWSPRHSSNAENFLFVDAHVSAIQQVNYNDVERRRDYERARDKDRFGNRPFWCWGLGKKIIGDM